jgi:hypothetical protein
MISACHSRAITPVDDLAADNACVDLTPLILTEGCKASACGRVVTAGDEVWFDPPLPVPLIYYEPGHEPAPRPSGLGVRVEGVALDRLDQRREKDGAVEGWTCLTGVWRDERLTVTEQSQRVAIRPETPEPHWTVPPCDPPTGGWPFGGADENIDVEQDLHGPEVITVTMFRPSARQVVAVIASDDPELTRRRLAPVLGDRLCVIESRWPGERLRHIRAELDARHREWLFYTWGEGADDFGQLQFTIELVRVVPSFAEFAGGLPDGLLLVDPWLSPVR